MNAPAELSERVWTLYVCPECHGHGPASVMCCHGSVYDPPRSSTERGGVRALGRVPVEVVAKERCDYTHSRDMEHIRAVEHERDRYREALTWISTGDLEGHWGQIAREALYPDRKAA